MHSLSAIDVREPVRAMLNKVMCQRLSAEPSKDTNFNDILLKCVVHILENSTFQRYFKKHLSEYVSLTKNFLNHLSKVNNYDLFVKALESIQSFNKQNPQQEQFCAVFVQELLVPLVEAHSSLCAESNLDTKVCKCIQEVVFSKARHRELNDCMCILFGLSCERTNIPEHTELLFHCLATAATSLPNNDVVIQLFAFILQAFVTSYKNDKIGTYQLFVILCYLVGFRTRCSIGKSKEKFYLLQYHNFKTTFHNHRIPKPHKVSTTSLLVLKRLITVLIKSNAQLDASVNELSFMDWLQALVLAIISKTDITAETFDVLCCIITLNPLIIEPKIESILGNVLLVEKKNIEMRQSYISFLCCAVGMFVKLYRLQKFVAKLLPTLRKSLVEKMSEKCLLVTLPDVLPEEVCAEFQNSLPTLPSTQTISMARSFTYHLVQDCVAGLENSQDDPGWLLYLQVLARLLSKFLRGVRMADHSVPAPVLERFTQALLDLRVALGQLGTAMLHKEHSRPLMVAFLDMCYNCGELQTLLMHYGLRSEVDSTLTMVSPLGDIIATNFEYLHSYLSNEQWSLVAERISNFGETACKESLNKLVLQKLRVMLLFSGSIKGSSEVMAAVAKHIVTHIGEAWTLLLSSDATLLVPMLSSEQLAIVAEHMVMRLAAQDSQYTEALRGAALQESRPLVIALTWAVLRRICKLFTKTKRKRESTSFPPAGSQLARDVLSSLDLHALLQTEEVEPSLLPIITKMATLVNDACEKYDVAISSMTNGFVLDVVSLEGHLRILKNLPIQFLSGEVQTVVTLSILAVAFSLKAMNVSEHAAGVRTISTELLLGLMEGPSPPSLASYLHMGHLIHGLQSADLPSQLLFPLLKQLFMASLRCKGTLSQLGTGVELLDKERSKLAHSYVSLQTASLLLRTLKRVRRPRVGSEDNVLRKKYRRRLSQGIIGFVKRVRKATASPPFQIMLESFSFALQSYLVGDKAKLSKVTPHIQTFVQAAFDGLNSPEVTSQHASVCVSLLVTVLHHKSRLEGCLPQDFVSQVWALLSGQRLAAVDESHIVRLLRVANTEELETIATGLLENTRTACAEGSAPGFEMVISLWRSIAVSCADGGRGNNSLLEACREMCQAVTFGELSGHAKSLLELEAVLAQRRQLQPQLVDVFLETVSAAPLQASVSLETWLGVFGATQRLLGSLLTHHSTLLGDRVPALLQGYQHTVASLAERSDQQAGLDQQDVSHLATCAHGVERITNAMVKLKKDLVRVSPYMVADILHQFEKFTVYPAVKLHLMNSVYCLLQLCDSHATSHLLRALPAASRELFKSVYSNYKKYYHFTGKV